MAAIELGAGAVALATSAVAIPGYGAGSEIQVPLTVTGQFVTGIFSVTAAVAAAAFVALEVETGLNTNVYEEVARGAVGAGLTSQIRFPFAHLCPRGVRYRFTRSGNAGTVEAADTVKSRNF